MYTFSALLPVAAPKPAQAGRRTGPLMLLALGLALGAARPAAAQTQLLRNPLPKNYRGSQPAGAEAMPVGMMRVRLQVVDAEGQSLQRALVRVTGVDKQLLSDEAGTLSLLVSLDNGPVRLSCVSFGYDEGQLSIERPEDNNLVFQLFRNRETALSPSPR